MKPNALAHCEAFFASDQVDITPATSAAATIALFDLAAPSYSEVVANLLPDNTLGGDEDVLAPSCGTIELIEGTDLEIPRTRADRPSGVTLAAIIGRSDKLPAEMRISLPQLSSLHCEFYIEVATLRLLLRDVSTNGTWVNGTRVSRLKVVPLENGDEICLVNPERMAERRETASTQKGPCTRYIVQRVKEIRTGSRAEEAVKDIVTGRSMFCPCEMKPCCHVVSASTIGEHVVHGRNSLTLACPVCNNAVLSAAPHAPTHLLIEEFLVSLGISEDVAHQLALGNVPSGMPADDLELISKKYFSAEELLSLQEKNIVGKNICFAVEKKRSRVEVCNDAPKGEEDAEYDKEKVLIDYVPVHPRQLRVTGEALEKLLDDHHLGTAPLGMCFACSSPVPLQVAAGGVPVECVVCNRLFCDLFHANSDPLSDQSQRARLFASGDYVTGGCGAKSGKGCLQRVKDYEFDSLPTPFLFCGNGVEQQILTSMLRSEWKQKNGPEVSISGAISAAWHDCLDMFSKSMWLPDDIVALDGQLRAEDFVCRVCAVRVFASLLYHFRRAVPPQKLPQAVSARPYCMYGRNCRTQFESTEHAFKFNHVCPEERRKE